MSNDVKVNLNSNLINNQDKTFEIEFNARYSDSILNGFSYINGKKHPEYDYIMAVLSQMNLEESLANHLATTNDVDSSFGQAAKDLEQAFVDELSENNSGYPTIGWWFDKFSPAENINMRIKS